MLSLPQGGRSTTVTLLFFPLPRLPLPLPTLEPLPPLSSLPLLLPPVPLPVPLLKAVTQDS